MSLARRHPLPNPYCAIIWSVRLRSALRPNPFLSEQRSVRESGTSRLHDSSNSARAQLASAAQRLLRTAALLSLYFSVPCNSPSSPAYFFRSSFFHHVLSPVVRPPSVGGGGILCVLVRPPVHSASDLRGRRCTSPPCVLVPLSQKARVRAACAWRSHSVRRARASIRIRGERGGSLHLACVRTYVHACYRAFACTPRCSGSPPQRCVFFARTLALSVSALLK